MSRDPCYAHYIQIGHFVAALSCTSLNFHVHSPEDDSSNYMNLKHDAGILFPVLREVAHVCIARARCTAGVEPNLTFPDWRAVQMERHCGLCVAWITDLVVSEARKNEMKKTIKIDAVHADVNSYSPQRVVNEGRSIVWGPCKGGPSRRKRCIIESEIRYEMTALITLLPSKTLSEVISNLSVLLLIS